jgi:hypothetical protein
MKAPFNMLFGHDRAPGCNAPNQWQAYLITHGVFQLNTTRHTRHKINGALALQGAQVLLSGIGRLKAKLSGDFSPGGRHTGFVNLRTDKFQNLALAGS